MGYHRRGDRQRDAGHRMSHQRNPYDELELGLAASEVIQVGGGALRIILDKDNPESRLFYRKIALAAAWHLVAAWWSRKSPDARAVVATHLATQYANEMHRLFVAMQGRQREPSIPWPKLRALPAWPWPRRSPYPTRPPTALALIRREAHLLADIAYYDAGDDTTTAAALRAELQDVRQALGRMRHAAYDYPTKGRRAPSLLGALTPAQASGAKRLAYAIADVTTGPPTERHPGVYHQSVLGRLCDILGALYGVSPSKARLLVAIQKSPRS